ncbi:hypothetical protein [Acidiferrobacter thiooxydans]|uniref:Uncharacterized protein n=1 Tax=Acidiferrobacter thiooxydans TaxID=163359 RepID=A0A1C2G3H6_9GAMM|nr:hypothetical protein [Acidiferrobacter thiooxydans]RCN58606.1 hypothetical protein C4900_02140 [Acidiferrobacter thiooxydans]UEO00220.1 hypothetical protein A9R16_002100 [Acidiferrobacter thiooxydans]
MRSKKRLGVPVVTIADRGSDFFEFLTRANELRAPYLIRARTNSAGRMAVARSCRKTARAARGRSKR